MTYNFAQDGSYDLIIVLSTDGATALDEIAPQYPDQKFTLVDNASDNPNVCNILKNGAEQTFLTGVIAGLMTTDDRFEFTNPDKKVGAIQGLDTATLNAMSTGFACGARFYDPEVEVLVSTVGNFTDVNTGKEMGRRHVQSGRRCHSEPGRQRAPASGRPWKKSSSTVWAAAPTRTASLPTFPQRPVSCSPTLPMTSASRSSTAPGLPAT